MLGWELPPHNSGGLGTACLHMCKALSSKGISIEFIVPYTAPHNNITFMKVTPALPVDVHDIQLGGMAYDSYLYTYKNRTIEEVSIFQQSERYVKAVENHAVLGKFDIIHAHDWLTFRAALRAKEISGKPLIAHVHATEFDRSGGKSGNPFVHEIEYNGLMLADKVVAVSQLTKNVIIQQYDIPADKIEVMHNGAETELYKDLDADNAYKYLSKMRSKGYRVVANVGRLTIQKGLYNLLLAAKEVLQRAPKTLFLLVGSGEQYIELLQLSADLGISKNVIFTDFQRGKNLRDAYAIADLFVMPSISEPFGIAPLEAIGYGTPVLVSKQSGVSEVLQNCLKVDFWDVQEMANQIYNVVRHDSLRDELYKESFKEYLSLSWDNTASKLVGAYHQHASIAEAI